MFVVCSDIIQDIDWGSIDVFTCSKSCQPPCDTPYMSEYCWRQPPPVVSGHQLDGPSSSENCIVVEVVAITKQSILKLSC